jgi:uncharacterized membrane protein
MRWMRYCETIWLSVATSIILVSEVALWSTLWTWTQIWWGNFLISYLTDVATFMWPLSVFAILLIMFASLCVRWDNAAEDYNRNRRLEREANEQIRQQPPVAYTAPLYRSYPTR